MPIVKAHDLTEDPRTADVLLENEISFKDMLLPEAILKGLEASNFRKPSPIQHKAIPLGRCGFDLIVQAKSGTGKTCVFSVIALEMLSKDIKKLQVLILAPTREIATQIKDVISSIGRGFEKLKVECFIGGMPIESDFKRLQDCQIAVGAPGRIKHLITSGKMQLSSVRLFVLDEADKLVEENMKKDVSYIYSKLPASKQVLAVSATFPEATEQFVSMYMANPIKVSPGKDVILLGIRQFVSVIPDHLSVIVEMKYKTSELIRILSTVPFKQCLVFSNYQSRAESICNELNNEGWPAIYLSGSQSQERRLKALYSLKDYSCRVLLSTDLTSRGIDAENVNLIINLDLPYDCSTYFHRIGRAGRYGSRGIAVTIVQSGKELQKFQNLLYVVGGENFNILKFPKDKTNVNVWEAEDGEFERVCGVAGEYQFVTRKKDCEVEVERSNPGEKKKNKNLEESQALSTIRKNRFVTPKDLVFDNYRTLAESLGSFKLNESNQSCNNVNSQWEIRDIPEEVLASVAALEQIGNAKFARLGCNKTTLDNSKPRSKLEKSKRNEKSEADDKVFNVVSEARAESTSNGPSRQLRGIRSEIKKEETVAESSEAEEEEEDDDDDDDEDDEEDVDESGDEINDSSYLTTETHRWYEMWFQHLRMVRHYIQYTHYWNEMLKFK